MSFSNLILMLLLVVERTELRFQPRDSRQAHHGLRFSTSLTLSIKVPEDMHLCVHKFLQLPQHQILIRVLAPIICILDTQCQHPHDNHNIYGG